MVCQDETRDMQPLKTARYATAFGKAFVATAAVVLAFNYLVGAMEVLVALLLLAVFFAVFAHQSRPAQDA